MMDKKLDYIHQNPVKNLIINQPEHYATAMQKIMQGNLDFYKMNYPLKFKARLKLKS